MPRRQTVEAARSTILRSHALFWKTSDFTLPESTVQHLMAELVKAGELRHVRKGLYWRGVQTPLGMAPPSPQEIVQAISPGTGVGPSGLSAANALGLSTQVPRLAEYAVPRRAPSSVSSVRFVARAARSGRLRAKLSAPEVAALEVLDDWEHVIEVSADDALNRLADLIRSRSLRPEKLAEAAVTEPAPARARLRVALGRAGRDDLQRKVPGVDPRTLAKVEKSLVTA